MFETIKKYCQFLGIIFVILPAIIQILSVITIHAETALPEPAATEVLQLSERLENAANPTNSANSVNTANLAEESQQIELLLQRGEAYRSLGHFAKAKADFSDALSKANALKYPLLEIIAMQSLGYIHYLQQDTKQAETLLRTALSKSELLGLPSPALAASCANRLGNVLSRSNRKNEALASYATALKYLKQAGKKIGKISETEKTSETEKISIQNVDYALESVIHRNIAHVLPDKEASFKHLAKALELIDQIDSAHEQTKLLLGIAAESEIREPAPAGDAFRYHTLKRALTLAENLDSPSPRLLSLAYGKLGALYESRNRIEDALTLTEQALTAAESIHSHDLLLQWEWQWGRLLKAGGERKKAIAAFQRALFHIDAIRQDITVQSEEGCTSFRTALFPIYTGLADMLLEQSGGEQDIHVQQQLLRQAQQAVEEGKQSELRDYFQDPCIDAASQDITTLSPSTAVIYPLVLPDRLEVLADIGGIMYRQTTLLTQEVVEQAVRQLAVNLRNNLFYESLGEEVYSWLIKPLESLLSDNRVDTLIFVPDGVFRLFPLAALWNGSEFLAQKYAVATEPGLTLYDPKPLPRGNMTALMAGMSEPGPVIMKLPKTLWNALCQIGLGQKNRWIRGLSVKVEQLKRDDPLKRDILISEDPFSSSGSTGESNQASLTIEGQRIGGQTVEGQTIGGQTVEGQARHVKEILKLPGVDREMEKLSGSIKGDLMMNDSFLLGNFASQLQQKDYSVIHIASHGFFGGSPDQNFIMTYDKMLNMNHLENIIKPKQFAKQPVELITLSACQTAEGDDRSPLGLSGVALKSGARSVLGSLWPVSDSATQELLSIFYDRLGREGITKAQALQQAQIALFNRQKYHHPFYWSAFILVGNWL